MVSHGAANDYWHNVAKIVIRLPETGDGKLVQHPTNNYALLAIYAMFLSWPGFPHLFI